MRKRSIMLRVIGAGVLVVVMLAFLLGGSEPTPPHGTLGRSAGGSRGTDSRALVDLSRPMQTVEVYVTTCKGAMAEGATVLAEVGKEHYSALTDGSGKARVRVPLDGEVDRFVAKRHGFEGELVPTGKGDLIDICPGATLYGRVIDVWGHMQPSVALELVDENGSIIDAIDSDPDGNYALTDAALDASGVRVAGELWPLDRLRAREQRELDLLIGQSRVVSGFVIDLAGDPVPGVAIKLRPMQFDGPGWSAVTSTNGGFSFIAPTTALRVDVDGGDLGRDRAWVNEGPENKDLELVLEPVGYIVVLKKDADAKDAKVALRCWDHAAFGPDHSWLNGPEERQEDEVGIEPSVLVEDGASKGELAKTSSAPSNAMADDEAPRSVVRDPFAMATVSLIDELAPELMPGEADELTVSELAASLAASIESLTPERRIELTTRTVLHRIELMARAMITQEPELVHLAGVSLDTPPAEPRVDVAVEGQVQDDDYAGMDVVELRAAELNAAFPDGVRAPRKPRAYDEYGTYAEGVLGETIAVPANLWYEVFVERDDGKETRCGKVNVKAGEEITVRCGGESLDSVVEGRFVDRRGEPIANLDVWVSMHNSEHPDLYRDERQMSGLDGRFRFQVEHDKPLLVSVGVGTPDAPWESAYGRRNVVLAPGDDKDVGDLVWLAEGERESWPTTEHGGIGGLIGCDESGAIIARVEDESPLALAGVENSTAIVLIDGLPASELPKNELFMRLNGASGTMLDLRLRSAEGELYEVTVERQLMAPSNDVYSEL